MNRFQWMNDTLFPTEKEIQKQSGVRLYDGDKKTLFEGGDLILTSHRLIWRDNQGMGRDLSLKHSFIVFIEEESAGWTKSAKIIAHLIAVSEEEKILGPVNYSPYNYVKLSFRSGGEPEFFRMFSDVLTKKEWANSTSSFPQGKKYRAGIVGIERQIQARNEATDRNISVAFEDLSCLMEMAKDMVSLSKAVSQKLKEKKEVSEDETVQFKSYLLSLGISDPVTKETYGSGDAYHIELAKQLSEMLEKPVKDAGGILSLTDVYCRVNRARGLELISPEDLINSCRMLRTLDLPLKLHTFESGVSILQLGSHNQNDEISQTENLLKEKVSLTADELSTLTNTSIVLAKERLLATEKAGKACRDDSIEGLRFFPNEFLLENVNLMI